VRDVLEPAPKLSSPVLIADIGGSTSRFALATAGERPQQIVVVSNATVATLEAAIRQYLDYTRVRPAAAIFAVAGPIDGDEVALTNRSWRFHARALAAQFGFSEIKVVNDFEALAWALLGLGTADTRVIGPAMRAGEGVKVVVGPGTGLGVAALIPHGGRWRAVASEGGHVSFGPGPREEIPVFEWLWKEYGHISAEKILSGPGLHRLYRAVNSGAELPDPETIVGMAKAGDPAACATTALFVRLLGRFAGSLALTFKATGGVYIAGGVATALGAQIDDAAFRGAFEAHPPHRELLATIPTSLVTCTEPGLVGCSALVEQLTGTEVAI
jgi:glucokinase